MNEKDCQAILSRPMMRKIFGLFNCQFIDREGRWKALKAVRSLGERACVDLILHHQNPQQLTANLWSAVRSRGCQFLGPGPSSDLFFLFQPSPVFFSHARRSVEIDSVGFGRWISVIA